MLSISKALMYTKRLLMLLQAHVELTPHIIHEALLPLNYIKTQDMQIANVYFQNTMSPMMYGSVICLHRDNNP